MVNQSSIDQTGATTMIIIEFVLCTIGLTLLPNLLTFDFNVRKKKIYYA